MSERRNKFGCLLVVVLIACCSITSCFGFFAFSSTLFSGAPSSLTSAEVVAGDYLNQIAVIDINGEIVGGEVVDLLGNTTPDPVRLIEGRLKAAGADSTVKAVILRLNTPGGTVYDSFKLADAVRKFKTDSNKTIISLVETSAASGGYLIASQTDYIMASNTSILGSIGVIVNITDTAELMSKLGIKNLAITSDGAEQKSASNITDTNSPEYKNLKEILNYYQSLFNDYVATGRKLDKEVVAKLADGSVESGQLAVNKKLADGIGNLQNAIDKTSELAGITSPRVFVYGSQGESLLGFPSLLNRLMPANIQSRTRQGINLHF